MKKEELPQQIETLEALLAWLNYLKEQYGDLTLDVRYDTGYGYGYFTPTSFTVEQGKLRIEVS